MRTSVRTTGGAGARERGRRAVSTPQRVQAPVLRVRALAKQFGDQVIVDGAGLDVPGGSVLGLVGPAGSGKTTLLAMVTGLLPPDEGTVQVLGVDAWAQHARARQLVAAMPDDDAVPDSLTGRELLIWKGLVAGLDARTAAEAAGLLLRATGLAEAEGRTVAEYTVGMRRRICLATALVRRPKLLVLDDPFAGVDEDSAATMRVVLRSFTAEGGSVLLASRSAESVCDLVCAVERGRVATGQR
ncbi:ABC transporter ATP-binding protein [Kutzneria viridogrisea]